MLLFFTNLFQSLFWPSSGCQITCWWSIYNIQFNIFINVHVLVHRISICCSLMQGYGMHNVYWMKCQQLTEFMFKSVINSFDKMFTISVTWIHQQQLCHKQALCSNTSAKHSQKQSAQDTPTPWTDTLLQHSNPSTMHSHKQSAQDTHSSLSTDFSSATKFQGINPSSPVCRCLTRHQSDSLQQNYHFTQ